MCVYWSLSYLIALYRTLQNTTHNFNNISRELVYEYILIGIYGLWYLVNTPFKYFTLGISLKKMIDKKYYIFNISY